MASAEVVARLEAELLHESVDVTRKYRALFALRNVANEGAVRALEKCLLLADADESRAARESSALLKHEVAYALGQIGMHSSIPTLERVLSDPNAHPMAGEALGAMGVAEAEPILTRFVRDPVREVAETCQLALDRLAFFRQSQGDVVSSTRHTSVDPAPPLDASLTIDELLQQCIDQKRSLFHRYRAMFSLRDRASGEAALALCKCFDDESALFKHEVAFVLGQMQRTEAAPRLREVLRNKAENIMVRHEAAEALGALTFEAGGHGGDDDATAAGGDETLELLRAHAHDEEAVVAHSALVALDIADYNISDEFHTDACANVSVGSTKTAEEWEQLKKEKLVEECKKRGLLPKSRDTKPTLAKLIADHDVKQANAVLAKAPAPPSGAPVRVVHDANVFQKARSPSAVVSPPPRIHGPPPGLAAAATHLTSPPDFFKKQLAAAAAAPATVPHTRVAPAVSPRSTFTPAAKTRKTVTPVAITPLRYFDAGGDDDDDDNDDLSPRLATPADRNPSRSVSPARSPARRDASAPRDAVAEAERNAHQLRLFKAGAAVVLAVALVLVVRWLLTDPDYHVNVAIRRLQAERGIALCDPTHNYTLTFDDLLTSLTGDAKEATITAIKSRITDVDEKGGFVSANQASPSLSCRLQLFAAEHWATLVVVAAVLTALAGVALRRLQSKWRVQRANAIVREVYNVLKAQAYSHQQGGAAEPYIAAVHLRDILLPNVEDHGAFWDGVLAQVQRNTCVTTSGRLIGGAQNDVLEWIAPIAPDHAIEAFRSPTRAK